MTNRDNLNQAILSIASKKASTDSSQSRHLEKMGTRYSGRGSSHYQYTFPNEQNRLTVPGFVKVDPATNLISQYLAKLIKPKKKTQVGKDPDKADSSSDTYNSSRQIVANLDIENYKLSLALAAGALNQAEFDRARKFNRIDAANKSKELEVPSIETANESTTESHMNNILKNKIKNQSYKVLFERFTNISSEVFPQSAGPSKSGFSKDSQKKQNPSEGENPGVVPPPELPKKKPVVPPAVKPKPGPKPEVVPVSPPAAQPELPDSGRLTLTPKPAPEPAPEPAPAVVPEEELPDVIYMDKPNTTPTETGGTVTDPPMNVYRDNTVYPGVVGDWLYGPLGTPITTGVVGAIAAAKSQPGVSRRVSPITGRPNNAMGIGLAVSTIPTVLRLIDQTFQGYKEGNTTNLIKGAQDQIPHLLADLFGLYGGATTVGMGKRVRTGKDAAGRPVPFDTKIQKGGKVNFATGNVEFGIPPSGPRWSAGKPVAPVAPRWPAGAGPTPVPGYTTVGDLTAKAKVVIPTPSLKTVVKIAVGAAGAAGTLALPGVAEKVGEYLHTTGSQSWTERQAEIDGKDAAPRLDYRSKDWYVRFINNYRLGGLPAAIRMSPREKESLTGGPSPAFVPDNR